MDNYTSDSLDNQTETQQWRADVATALCNAGHELEADAFLHCGDEGHFNSYLVCASDPSEYAVPMLHTCHRRYCPDCEKRAQAERLAKFLPAIQDACNLRKSGYSLKHLVLTTPYDLKSDEIFHQYARAWDAVRDTLVSLFFELRLRKATPEEKSRKRLSLTNHGIGAIVCAEFGEEGHKLHFHILAYCPYIDKERLWTAWELHTAGDCLNVHIRRIRDVEEGAKEVICKYVTKLGVLPPDLVPRLRQVLHGTRRIRSYGIFHGLACPDEVKHCECPVCGGPLMWMPRHEYEEGIWGKDAPGSLVLIPGNNSGETGGGKDPPNQVFLPGLGTNFGETQWR